MNRCEVLIVGGGPAGATCARPLKQAGLDVMVMDRAEFPREKPCAGWITPAVLETLEIDPESYRKGHLLQEIREFRTAPLGGRELVTSYQRTVSYGIRRGEFDHFLLLRSAARHRLGEGVRAVERVPDGWLVNGSIRARLLIGAGGHYCPVSRALNGGNGGEPVFAAQVCEFSLDEEELEGCGIAAGVPALFFTADLQGYGWVVRKGRYLNVGLGSRERKGVPRLVADFCAFLQRRGGIPQLPRKFRGHAYLSYGNGRRAVGDAALLIGDAAGVAYPESGEGILPSVESAILAAHAIVAAHGDYRREKLRPYEVALAARLGSGSDSAAATPEWARRYGGALLLSSRWLTRRILLDRWFLHEGQEKLTLAERGGEPVAPSVVKQPT